uniref:Nucleotidyl transferase n=2 Tax=root TaxID=1 RepID=A0A481YYR4_9VIRU|nr:MAG: nucleotidyl transferase [Marseillevirus LCMAC202]
MENYSYQPLVQNKQGNEWMYIFDPRGPEVYTGDIKNAIDIITLDQEQPAKIVGSFKYRVHRYPGDIDMLEFYEGCCTLAESKRDIVKKLKDIAIRIKQHRGVYLGDFKAGEDTRFKFDIGRIEHDKIVNYNSNKIIEDMNELYKKKLLTKTEMNNLYALAKPETTLEDWNELKEALRKLYTVRWSLKDLEDGKKKLVGGKVITLSDAISQGTIIKIDIFTQINGRYTEVTNFFALSGRDENGQLVPFTEDFPDYRESLKKEIEQRIKEGKYLKVAKRLWLLALNQKDIDKLKRLFGLFSSPAAELRQMAAEAETLSTMLLTLSKPPLEEIHHQIDGFKLRIADIPSTVMSDSTRRILYNMVGNAILSNSYEYIAKQLNSFDEVLGEIYNTYAKVYLEAVNMLKVKDRMSFKTSGR